MKRLILFLFVCVAIPLKAESESEKTFREAIPGHYIRREGGIASLHLDLLQNGAYVFQLVGDMGVIDAKRGKWKMVDDEVVLSGPGIYDLHRFRVYSSARIKGLSLLPLEDEKYREKDEDEDRLFLRTTDKEPQNRDQRSRLQYS